MKILEKIKRKNDYKNDIIKTQILIVLSKMTVPITEKQILKMIYAKNIKKQLKELKSTGIIQEIKNSYSRENEYVLSGEKV